MSHEMGFDLFFPGHYLKQALAVSLLSVWVLVGLFFYLNHYTKRRYFTIWAAGWLFYALWLTLNFSLGYSNEAPWLMMLKQWCVSAVALFLFWGSARFLGQRVRQVSFALFATFLLVWSWYGAYHLEDPLQVRLPIFGLIAIASLRVSFCFYVHRRRRQHIGAGLLAVGFTLWGLFHFGYPFLYRWPDLFGAGFFAATVLQLFIAVSMIVLVLEEARQTHGIAFQNLAAQAREKADWRVRAESTEARYRNLFENAGEAIVITTRDRLLLLDLNRAAVRLFAQPLEELRGKSLLDFCPPRPAKADEDPSQWLCAQRPLHLKRRDGWSMAVEATGGAVEYDGQPAYQFFLHELSERAQLEQQLRQKEKLAALGQMVSGIAHELNNPLTVVKGYLELILAHRKLDPDLRASLEKVAHESNRAAKLVQNFLAFARERPPQRERTQINEVIQRVLELRRFAVAVAGVRVTTDLAPDLPPTLADADQIQQVLVILVNNALQAMAELQQGGHLHIRSCVANQKIQVFVKDDGPGVPPHLERKIFEPFFSTKEVGGGTGLGLSIAHSLMSEHRGRVYHQRPPEGGACFVLELPVVAPEASARKEPDAGENPAAVGPTPGRVAEVLVLDDEKAITEMVGEMLSLAGYKATACVSPHQALEILRQRSFSLILSDIRMPGMDGRQFYAEVRKLDPALANRIVFLTGDTVNEETREFLQRVGNPHLAKPFSLKVLKQTIGAVCATMPAVAASATKAET